MSTQPKGLRPLNAMMALGVLFVSTCLGFIPILLIGLLKLMPIPAWQARCTRWVDGLVTLWCDINNTYIKKKQLSRFHITGLEQVRMDNWYLVVANHQSWLDIVVLIYLFNRKIPVLKFFIKDQLKWIPLLGFSWWAMGCPFMKRYSKAYLAKKPHKKGQDVLATQKAIQRFKTHPVSVMNFVEGTRFTPAKKLAQQSPYQHILKPKAGGIGFVIQAMGHQINSLLDVTIVYSGTQHSLWDFLCGRVSDIHLDVQTIPIPEAFYDSNRTDQPEQLSEFRDWINAKWAEKDKRIASYK